jgi:hypothetical protein
MSAIALTREVRAVARAEGWLQSTTLNNILRGAPKTARISGTTSSYAAPHKGIFA